MEDKKSLDKLSKITEHLKAISDKLSVAVGVDSKGGSTKVKKILSPEEIAKIKQTAKETALVYKSILGLGFNQKDADNTANRFRVVLGITPFFNTLQKGFNDIKTFIQNAASSKAKLEIKDQIKVSDLEKFFDRNKLYQNSVISNLSNISTSNSRTFDFLSKYQTEDKNILSELQKITNNSNILSTNSKTQIDLNQNILSELQKISISSESSSNNLISGSNLNQNILSELQKISNNTDSSFKFLKSDASNIDMMNVLGSITNNTDLSYKFLTSDASNADLLKALIDIKNINKNKRSKNYTNSLNEIKLSLSNILSTLQSKVYEPIISYIASKLDDIKSTFDNKIGKIKPSPSEYVKSVNAFKRLLGWDELKNGILDYIDRSEIENDNLNYNIERLVDINEDMRDKVDNKSTSKTSGGGDSIMSKIGNVALLATLGVGLFLIIGALVKANQIQVGQTLKVVAVIAAIVGLFVLVGKVGQGIKSASIGFAILAATMFFLILPLMDKLGKMDFGTILNGLFKLAIVMSACIGIMVLMNFIKASEVIKSSAGLGLLTLVIGFLVIPFLLHITKLDFDKLIEGLFKMGIVMTAFILLMTLMNNIKSSEVIKSSAGLGLLVLVIGFLAIPFFEYLASLNFDTIIEGLLKFGVIFAACYGMVYLMQKIKASDVVKSSLGLTLLALLMGFVVIPLLLKMSALPFDNILTGLALMGLAVLGLAGIVRGTGEILTRGKNGGVSSVVGLVAIGIMSLLLGYLADTMVKFAGKPWQEILTGVGTSILAITAFGAVVLLVGKIASKAALDVVAGALTLGVLMLLMWGLAESMNKFGGEMDWGNIAKNLALATVAITAFGVVVGIVGAIAIATAPFMLAGAATFLGLEVVMYGLAVTLLKFNEVNASQIGELGKSLIFLGAGLVAFLGGSIAGAGAGMINGLTGLFKMDPASQIKKFEAIDSEKIYKIGLGLSYIAKGLSDLSNGKISLTDVTNEMIQMTKPLSEFSSALDAFSNAYAKIDKVKLKSEYTMNVEKDDSIQSAIKSLHEQELQVQQQQLTQLQQNGEYLRIIASKQGEGSNPMVIGGSKGRSESISAPNFETKNYYMNNMKLATMSFDA